MRKLDTIQLNRQKLNFQSYPKPKKQFVCLYGKNFKYRPDASWGHEFNLIGNIPNIVPIWG